jgi:hypothetical protein
MRQNNEYLGVSEDAVLEQSETKYNRVAFST